ncbi:unnamed protein product [Soboliphyme baturini]|uniref:C2CD5 C-terminal domain-containing protein n=1 Tax=Soboliphyme baturini TaxID=241478 RepID=A0A183J3G4_9BILA|nr:unnamed protein product [Soboliphyme baturini]
MSDSHLEGPHVAVPESGSSKMVDRLNSPSLSHLFAREIFLTPLVTPLFTDVKAYLGYFNFFFIRETTGYREIGGLEAFVHSSVTEIFHIVQAHVAASGGHGILGFKVSINDLSCNPGRNQAQFLLGVSGDIVTTV